MRGPRIVMVPESGTSEAGLDALARAFSQHPRMLFFAVYVTRHKDFKQTDWKLLQQLSGERSSFCKCKLMQRNPILACLQHGLSWMQSFAQL